MAETAQCFLRCPFRILIDQREKKPYSFAGLTADAHQNWRALMIETVSAYLPTGDYTIEGFQDRVAIEKKSLDDLFCTLGQHRDRFEREIERLAVIGEAGFAAVVVEAEWSEILRSPPPRSELNPKTVIRSVMAWQVRFPRVAWWTVPGRVVAEAVTFRLLHRFWTDAQKKAKETVA